MNNKVVRTPGTSPKDTGTAERMTRERYCTGTSPGEEERQLCLCAAILQVLASQTQRNAGKKSLGPCFFQLRFQMHAAAPADFHLPFPVLEACRVTSAFHVLEGPQSRFVAADQLT